MLLQFLRAITTASHINKMTLNSVAMIIAPNLFLVGTLAPVGNTGARRPPKRIRELLEVSTAAGISSVIRLVIYYQDLLWQVSYYYYYCYYYYKCYYLGWHCHMLNVVGPPNKHKTGVGHIFIPTAAEAWLE